MSEHLLAKTIGSYWAGYDWPDDPGSLLEVVVVREPPLDHLDASVRPVVAVIRRELGWHGLRRDDLDWRPAKALVDREKRAWILGPEHDGKPHAEHVFHMPG